MRIPSHLTTPWLDGTNAGFRLFNRAPRCGVLIAARSVARPAKVSRRCAFRIPLFIAALRSRGADAFHDRWVLTARTPVFNATGTFTGSAICRAIVAAFPQFADPVSTARRPACLSCSESDTLRRPFIGAAFRSTQGIAHTEFHLVVLAAWRPIRFTAFPITGPTLVGILHAFIIPCDLAAGGINPADTRGHLLILASGRIICEAARSIACAAVLGTLPAVFREAAFVIPAHGRCFTGIHTLVVVVVDFGGQGKPEDEFRNNRHIDHVHGRIAIPVSKGRVLADAVRMLSFSCRLPERDEDRALHVHNSRNRVLVNISWWSQTRRLNWRSQTRQHGEGNGKRENLSAPEPQSVHSFPHLDSPMDGVNLLLDVSAGALHAPVNTSSSACPIVHYWCGFSQNLNTNPEKKIPENDSDGSDALPILPSVVHSLPMKQTDLLIRIAAVVGILVAVAAVPIDEQKSASLLAQSLIENHVQLALENVPAEKGPARLHLQTPPGNPADPFWMAAETREQTRPEPRWENDSTSSSVWTVNSELKDGFLSITSSPESSGQGSTSGSGVAGTGGFIPLAHSSVDGRSDRTSLPEDSPGSRRSGLDGSMSSSRDQSVHRSTSQCDRRLDSGGGRCLQSEDSGVYVRPCRHGGRGHPHGGNQRSDRQTGRKCADPRGGQITTGLMGLVIFFDDYANTVVVGSAARKLTDGLRISREKLAYIVDSTSAPIAGLALVSTWIGYEVGLFTSILPSLRHVEGLPAEGYGLFFEALPSRFYCFFALALVFLSAGLKRDFGPMLRAERRARRGGGVLPPVAGKEEESPTEPEQLFETGSARPVVECCATDRFRFVRNALSHCPGGR